MGSDRERRLEAALREVQWGDGRIRCPLCRRYRHAGHKGECPVTLALALTPDQPASIIDEVLERVVGGAPLRAAGESHSGPADAPVRPDQPATKDCGCRGMEVCRLCLTAHPGYRDQPAGEPREPEVERFFAALGTPAAPAPQESERERASTVPPLLRALETEKPTVEFLEGALARANDPAALACYRSAMFARHLAAVAIRELRAMRTSHAEMMRMWMEEEQALATDFVDLVTVHRVLREHWLTAMECNHEAKTDTVRCYCTVWTGTPQPSVAAAIEQWVEHVLNHLRASLAAPASPPAERGEERCPECKQIFTCQSPPSGCWCDWPTTADWDREGSLAAPASTSGGGCFSLVEIAKAYRTGLREAASQAAEVERLRQAMNDALNARDHDEADDILERALSTEQRKGGG